MPVIYKWFCIFVVCLITGCSHSVFKKQDGGFHNGDRPPKQTRDFDKIPNAIPKVEPYSKTGNKPYKALGKNYKPLTSSLGFKQIGTASWYGEKFHGRRTSSGETYDMWAMTAAHPTLPLPTYVEVTNLDNGKVIVVKVNDRGPFLHNRIIDLSFVAAHKIDIVDKGTGRVKIRALRPQADNNIDANNAPVSSARVSGTAGGATNSQILHSTIFLQIGAYSDFNNATAMRRRLEILGYTPYPKSDEQTLKLGRPYKVQVGPFDNLSEAMQRQNQLQQMLNQSILLIE